MDEPLHLSIQQGEMENTWLTEGGGNEPIGKPEIISPQKFRKGESPYNPDNGGQQYGPRFAAAESHAMALIIQRKDNPFSTPTEFIGSATRSDIRRWFRYMIAQGEDVPTEVLRQIDAAEHVALMESLDKLVADRERALDWIKTRREAELFIEKLDLDLESVKTEIHKSKLIDIRERASRI